MFKKSNQTTALEVISTQGKSIPWYKAKDADLEAYIISVSDDKKAEVLTEINIVRKFLGRFEAVIKKYIQNEGKLKFFGEEASFVNWKIKKVKSKRFNEKKLMEEGTEEEKKIYQQIKKKYMSESEYMRFTMQDTVMVLH